MKKIPTPQMQLDQARSRGDALDRNLTISWKQTRDALAERDALQAQLDEAVTRITELEFRNVRLNKALQTIAITLPKRQRGKKQLPGITEMMDIALDAIAR